MGYDVSWKCNQCGIIKHEEVNEEQLQDLLLWLPRKTEIWCNNCDDFTSFMFLKYDIIEEEEDGR